MVGVVLSLAAIGLHLVSGRAGYAAAFASATVFVVLVVIHARVDRERDRKQAGVAFHDRALARHGDDEPPRDVDGHPYATDLDIVGKGSVAGLISLARTQPGARTLVRWLLGAHEPPELDEIRTRQSAARVLSTKPALTRALWVAGTPIHERRSNAVAFEWWAMAQQPAVVGVLDRVLAWAWPPITVLALILGHLRSWPTWATWGPYAGAVVFSLAIRPRIGQVAAAAVAHEGGALAFADAFDAALADPLDDPLLSRLQREIEVGRTALRALRPSTRALESLQNEVLRLLLAPIAQVELHAALALERWRKKHGAAAATWFSAYGSLEALASLGMLAHDFPAFAWPELTTDLRFDARALGHPLVPADKRICNDVGPLDAGHAMVITGSNMSGKSTLLRSIGVATAMALAGAPVCASKLTVGRVRLVTSMHVADSLAEGASRFYAELKKLKVVIDMAGRGAGVLFLLDEMLYGTNARERLIGSRSTLAWLLEHDALGAVSTHDLALAMLEGPLASRARNVHFEEQVSNDVMSFDFKLRDGVVQSSNALRLMKELGLPVEQT